MRRVSIGDTCGRGVVSRDGGGDTSYFPSAAGMRPYITPTALSASSTLLTTCMGIPRHASLNRS